eukprot:366562-Chlamydomonas_euryale.AAC.20
MLLCECSGCAACKPTLRGGDNSGCYCIRAHHLSCLESPLKRVPKGAWTCPPCTAVTSAAAAAASVNVSGSDGQQPGQRAGSVGDGGDGTPLSSTEVVPEPAVIHGGIDCDPDGGDFVPVLDAECARCVARRVDIMHHFSVNRAKRGEVDFEFVNTQENLADLLTKPLQRVKIFSV